MLAGDDQIVRIWDLKAQKTIQTFEDLRNRWGQVTSMLVSDTAITGGAMLCCGTGRGQVLIFRRLKKKVGSTQNGIQSVSEGDLE